MTKIVHEEFNKCFDCPYNSIDLNAKYSHCAMNGRDIEDIDVHEVFPLWCPLPDKEMQKTKSCLECERCETCPIIKLWIERTQSPIESTTFYCSEYQEIPKQ